MFPVEVDYYPDQWPRITERAECTTILLRPRSVVSFFAAMFYVDALVARSEDVPALVLPCVPGQRQDRLNDEGDFLFTARSMAKEINMRKFPVVVIADPHSDVMPALIERCVVVPASSCLAFAPIGTVYDGVIAPDAGSEKRAAGVARSIGCPVVHAGKHRDVSTGKITGFWLQDGIEPGHYLVVDDLCDAGGTFLGLQTKIAEAGVTADLYVTHGLFTKGTDELIHAYESVYCTDSTLGPKPNVEIIPICGTLLESYR